MGPKKYRANSYQVCITILEGRHLSQNANPLVVVKVGNHKRKTMYFVFDLYCNLDELLSTKIMIAVYLKHYIRMRFHGSTSFEVALVWEQPDRQYYHKWAMLTNPKNLAAGSKGYIKCNIAINVRGEKMIVHPETEGEDDIEGNLLLPVGGGTGTVRQQARYIFMIYRADGLPDMSSLCSRSDFENINPFVQISFAGMKRTTSEAWQTYEPRFNEKITFREMFPSLCQRVRITIKHRIDSCRTCLVASYILNMSSISNSEEYGFLPTFGPSFIHFYDHGTARKTTCCGKLFTPLPVYRGRVLLSLKTEMETVDVSSGMGAEIETIAPIIEKSLWSTEEYYLVAVLYDASLIDRKFSSRSISFEVSIGNAGNRRFSRSQCHEDNDDDSLIPEQPTDFESGTTPRMTGSLDGKYNYLPLGSRKPCFHVKSYWPNLEWRMHNANNLGFIADFLERKLEELEELVELQKPEAYEAYNETICELRVHCIHYLQILDTGRYDEDGGNTKLDRHRVNLCIKKIESILKKIKINGELPSNHYMRIAMAHAYQYLVKLRKLREEPQHSLPDVFVWMISGSKRVACTRLEAGEIIFSEEENLKGRMCGQKMDVLMRHPGDSEDSDYTSCKAELFLWLGNANYAAACWSSVPPGYEVDHEMEIDHFPMYLEYTRSAVIKQTLDPCWDQTLILPPRTLHGTTHYIKRHPPKVVLEVFDQDICGTKEFCGRCTAIPLVKLAEETYSPPDFPPKLEWYKFKSQRDCSGSVLAAFELIEVTEDEATDEPIDTSEQETIYNIPDDIRPKMTSYRLEVIFWGVRDMKRIHYMSVLRPRIVIECPGVFIKSEVMENAKKFCNFGEPHTIVDLEMPELAVYYPSITIKVYDSWGFGCFKYAGICIIPSIVVFLEQLLTAEDYDAQIHEDKSIVKPLLAKKQPAVVLPLPIDYDPLKDESSGLIPYKKMTEKNFPTRIQKILRFVKKIFARVFERQRRKRKKRKDVYKNEEDESLDWWNKYFASLEEARSRQLGTFSPEHRRLATFEVYDGELEMQPQFGAFNDRLRTFELWKGKKVDNPDYEGDNFAGKFKGRIIVYRWPPPDNVSYKMKNGRDAVNGFCDDYPSTEAVRILVRIYVIKGINLQPSDPLTGRSDPYLCVRLGKTFINDRKNFIPNQLNPTFGRLFEIEATFPQDYQMTVQVWDHDTTSADDLIGETKIDLENRFYSQHRATCGISRSYSVDGYNRWRDQEKPTHILANLCRRNNLPPAEYKSDYVKIGRKRLPFVDTRPGNEADREERMALNVLRQWQDFPICGCDLVPEHVERRPLFNVARRGLEQGKLELWIDMFQFSELPPKPPVDIHVPLPREYEIRVIVWNTEDVPLVDSQFLTGEKCSDIYVKGWIIYEDHQKTDIHYNSLNGEGNFNWRFIFRVTYSKSEHVIIVRRKMSVLARNETEDKLPCKLYLQVWDSDHLSPDDFLGALTLDLSKMPRGSNNSKRCTLKLLDPGVPTMDLFKMMRIKAWWPFSRSSGPDSYVQAGKVELEMSVSLAEEANQEPAGKGRNPPQSLPPPNRPDTSFSWFRNPWKAFRYVVCRYYKWRIIGCLMCVLLVLLICCAIYAFPNYLVKRLVGA